jgi:phosphoadenosine phosphosulfate reductase
MTGTDTGTRPALRDEQQLRDLAAAGAAALHAELDAEGRVPAEGEASTEEAIRWVAENFDLRSVTVACSMADAVLPALVAEQLPGVDVLFLETGYHFAETIGTRDAVEVTMPVNLLTIEPVQSVAEQDATHGKDLYRTDPDRCCALRKVAPLTESLTSYDAWATGLRRAETHNRVIAPVIGWDARKGKVKVSPLARWSDDQVERYIADNDVLVNPLVYDGYPSLGCWPCTRRVAPGDDPRSGRWAGTSKTECGIH